MAEANILVVDDEREVCELLSDWLSQESAWTVDYTTEPLRALEQIGQGQYDVMVTDICMPQLDGLDLARQVRQLSPGLRIIGVTGYASVSSSVEAMRLGFADYLQKPFRMDEVRAAVVRALEAQQEQQQVESCADVVTADNAHLAASNNDLSKRLELVSRDLTLMQQRLAGRVADLASRCEAADLMDGERDLDRLLAIGLMLLRNQLAGQNHALLLVDHPPPRVQAVARIDGGDVVVESEEWPLEAGIVRSVVRRKQAALVEELSGSAIAEGASQLVGDTGSLLVLPMLGGGEVQAVALVRRDDAQLGFGAAEVRRATSVCAEVGKALETAKRFRDHQQQAFSCLVALAESAEDNDGEAEGHGRRVARRTRGIARRLGVDEQRMNVLEIAGRLHDIGLLTLPQEFRAGGHEELTEADLRQRNEHAAVGGRLLENFGFMSEVSRLIGGHHGTMLEMDAEQQALVAAEIYDELTHDGPFGLAISHEEAMHRLRSQADQWGLDAATIEALDREIVCEM